MSLVTQADVSGNDNVFFNPLNGHYYFYVSGQYTWHEALSSAEIFVYQGMTGHLLTITSADEQSFISTVFLGLGNAWIAASDQNEEGEWSWVAGPENGTQFWSGYGANGTYGTPGVPVDDQFNAWRGLPYDAPNERPEAPDQDVAHILLSDSVHGRGSWEDTHSYLEQSFIVEFSPQSPPVTSTLILDQSVGAWAQDPSRLEGLFVETTAGTYFLVRSGITESVNLVFTSDSGDIEVDDILSAYTFERTTAIVDSSASLGERLDLVQSEFGGNAGLTDWLDLENATEFVSPEMLVDLLDLREEDNPLIGAYLGDVYGNEGPFVTVSGSAWYNSTRAYFVSGHEGTLPASWLAHDTIDNHVIDLGSWTFDRDVLSTVFLTSSVGWSVSGSALDDSLDGANGHDEIRGLEGNDYINGADGDDTLFGGVGADFLEGDAGSDVLVLESSEAFTSGFYAWNVSGSFQSGTDEYVSVAGKNRFADVLNGGGDFDTVELTEADDALFLHDSFSDFHQDVALSADFQGRQGAQRIEDIERILAGAGDDVVDLTSPDYSLTGQNILVDGGDGADVLWGSDANETILGGAGDDDLFGGSGSNVLTGGAGADEFQFTLTSTNDTVTDFNIADGDSLKFFNTDGAVFDRDSVVVSAAGDSLTISYGSDPDDFIEIQFSGPAISAADLTADVLLIV